MAHNKYRSDAKFISMFATIYKSFFFSGDVNIYILRY